MAAAQQASMDGTRQPLRPEENNLESIAHQSAWLLCINFLAVMTLSWGNQTCAKSDFKLEPNESGIAEKLTQPMLAMIQQAVGANDVWAAMKSLHSHASTIARIIEKNDPEHRITSGKYNVALACQIASQPVVQILRNSDFFSSRIDSCYKRFFPILANFLPWANQSETEPEHSESAAQPEEVVSLLEMEKKDEIETNILKRGISKILRGTGYNVITTILVAGAVILFGLEIYAFPDDYNLINVLHIKPYTPDIDLKAGDKIRGAKVGLASAAILFGVAHLYFSYIFMTKSFEVSTVATPIRELFDDAIQKDDEGGVLLELESTVYKKSDGPEKADALTGGPYQHIHDLAKRLMHTIETSPSGRISSVDLYRTMIDVGVTEAFAKEVMKEVPIDTLTRQSLSTFSNRGVLSISELIFDQAPNFGFFFVAILTSVITFALSRSFIDVSTCFCALALLFVFFLSLQRRAYHGLGYSQGVESLLTAKLEMGLFKVTLTLILVFLFAFFYNKNLLACAPAPIVCPNNAVPICIASGMPPTRTTCFSDGTMPCVGLLKSSAAVCPNQLIPGARSDKGELFKEWFPTMQSGELFLAPSHGPDCYAGILAKLCSDTTSFVYTSPGTFAVIPDILQEFSLSRETVTRIAAVTRDGDCSDQTARLASTPVEKEGDLSIFSPSSDGVYDVCAEVSGTWSRIGTDPKRAVLVVAAEASCGNRECTKSDFTPTMSTDFLDSLYFAMVTHSTVGYGDISPTTKRGMMVVAMQSMFVMFINYF